MSSSTPTRARDRRLLVVVLVVLLVALGYLMVWRPKAGQLADVRRERAALQATVASTTATTTTPAGSATTAVTTAEGAANAAIDQRLAAAVPATPGLPDLLRGLEAAAAQSGVQSPSISASAPGPGPKGSEVVTLTVAAQASQEAAYDYLGRLATGDRLLIIDNVDIHDGSLSLVARAFSTGA